MRSHAKASSAGSNSGRAKSRGSLLAGLLLSLLVTACMVPGAASAIELRPLAGSFGPDGTSGTLFSSPAALTFDQGSKRLYALDQGTQEIHAFDAPTLSTHSPLGGSFPLTAPGASFLDDIAADSSSHNLYFVSHGEKKLYGFDENGAPRSGFPAGGLSGPCGAAVDPAGNVWVGDFTLREVKEYDSSGNPIGSVNTGGFPCQVAFDSEANLYVSFFFGVVRKYTAASGYTASSIIDSEAGPGIAIDRSSGEIYVLHYESVSVYDHSGTLLYEFAGAGLPFHEFAGIALNQATEEVYLSEVFSQQVMVFGPPLSLPKVRTEAADGIGASAATLRGTVNPKGIALEDCHFEFVPATQFFNDKYASVTAAQKAPCVPTGGSIPADSNDHAVSADLNGLSAATTYHFRIVAANSIGTSNGSDRTFTTAALSPAIESQSAQTIGTSEATLSAKINPRGGQTTYHVEYGKTNSYGQSSAESAAFGSPTDNNGHIVSVHISNLDPGTAYHFRFVATSSTGVAEGADTTFVTYAATPSLGSCPNDEFRARFGTRLPDCRAYEQASPIDKHGSDAKGTLSLIEASTAGDRVTFFTNGGLPTSGGSSELYPFLATRYPDGWRSDGLQPPTDPGDVVRLVGWSEDLSTSVTVVPGGIGVGGQTLYTRDSDTAIFQPGPVSSEERSVFLAGFAADTSHLLFETRASLLPGVPPRECGGSSGCNVYDLDHGSLTLVGRIPAGSATACDDATGPTCVDAPNGAFAGPYDLGFVRTNWGGAAASSYTQNTISRDGSRVFFTAYGTGQLYVRENGTKTTRISASQRITPDPNGEKPAAFLAATPDGSKVFFMSCEKLTDDSTAVSTADDECSRQIGVPPQGQDLYSYDVNTGELTDLTVDSNAADTRGAAVRGVLGVSEDGTNVYFAAAGALAPGAVSEQCDDKCNLYVSHDGVTKYIARVGREGDANWLASIPNGSSVLKQSRVSADGSTLLFQSKASLTGYNNNGPCDGDGSTARCNEFFRYSAADEKLVCVSCNPTGIPPIGNTALASANNFITGAVNFKFLTRNLSADGNRAFFETPDALVHQDTNGLYDVYEWEAKGTGSCKSETQNGGCIYLLSTGTGSNPSTFADASANGDHVFLFTDQQLVPTDEDELADIYDAGIGAGLASQHVLAPPTCATTACQANPAPPPDQTPASAAFSGPGNFHKPPSARKCPKGKRRVNKAGKARCQKAQKKHKRHNNRGGAK